MAINSNVQVDFILHGLRAANRKQAFQMIASEISKKLRCNPDKLFDGLMDKEKLASSGIGDGVSIPHLRVQDIPGRFIALATLERPVQFESIDQIPVDLICVLLSAEREGPVHLRRLARVSRLMKNKELCQKLREAHDEDTVRSLLIDPEGWLLAA